MEDGTMNAAALTMLPVERVERRGEPGASLLDDRHGYLGLGRSRTFPFPQYRADDEYSTVFFDQGEGHPIVLVHGLGANATHWELVVRDLVEDHRVVGLDLVGLGWSRKPRVQYTIDLLRDHLLDFLDRRGIRRATLVGHSMGGAVCLAAAVKRPCLVDALALICAAGVAPLPRWMRAVGPHVLHRGLLFPALGLGARFILRNVFVESPEDNPHVRWFYESALHDGPARNNLFDFARVGESLCADIIGRDYSAAFPSIKIPVLALWGDADKLSAIPSVLRSLGGLPRLRTVMLRRTGHMPMVERPEETLFHLRRFLSDPP
jgi:pimeloyl-ACP methyl ester carboxylesterase